MKINIFILAVVVTTLFSCGFNANKYYTPTEANATKASASLETLIAGRTKYIQRCGECHKLYKPSKHYASQWKQYLNKMQERAEITDAEKANILAYLSSEI